MGAIEKSDLLYRVCDKLLKMGDVEGCVDVDPSEVALFFKVGSSMRLLVSLTYFS